MKSVPGFNMTREEAATNGLAKVSASLRRLAHEVEGAFEVYETCKEQLAKEGNIEVKINMSKPLESAYATWKNDKYGKQPLTAHEL